jgi:hypothetical protein
MNKVSALLVVVISIFAALLLARPQTSAAAHPFASRNAGDISLEQQVVAKEREGLDALKSGNVELFGNLAADDAVLVDAHGPATKAQVLKNVAEFTLSDYSMDNLQFVPLSPNSGLITYKISEKGVSHGKEFAAQAWVSSIWAHRGDKWLCVFSQETGAR